VHVLAQSVTSDAAGHKVIISSPASLYRLGEEIQRFRHVFILLVSQVEFLLLWVGIAKQGLLWVQNSSTEHCFVYTETVILTPFWCWTPEGLSCVFSQVSQQ